MKEPLVSVIIPTYNRLEYIQIAIDSVLQQTYKNYEVIVIDDGSADATKEVIPVKYAGKIKYYYQENHGRSAARNFGASLAQGNYLAFLDSDDVWISSKLQKQVDEFSKSAGFDVAAVCSSAYFIDKSGNLIHKAPIGRNLDLYQYELERFFVSPIIVAPPSNMLIRRECFDEVGGFDNGMSYGEDWDLVIKIRRNWRFLYIDEPLFYFRFNSKFLNRLPPQDQIPEIINDLERLYRRMDVVNKKYKDPNFLVKSISKVHEQAAYWYFAHKVYPTGMEHLLCSGKLNYSDLDIVINKLGYWGAYSAIEYKNGDPSECEHEFKLDFYPNVTNMLANEIILPKSQCRKLFSSFYHNLAWHLFPEVNGQSIQNLCLKAMGNDLHYIFSKETMKMLIVSTYFACKGILENGNIARKKPF